MNLQDYSSFVLKQRVTLLINRYEYFGIDGATEVPVAFVEQKRFKMKEEITAWSGEDRAAVVYAMKAEKVLDVHGKYLITGADGRLVGYLRKAFGRSILRSTWEVYDAADTLLLTVQEKNQTVAIVRRLGALVPIVGDVLQLLPFNFHFLHNDQVVGTYHRIIGLRDHYKVQLEPAAADIDRRLILALGIALDALQSR